jgi:ParB-like chromosome segregation protein Spo0J
MTTPQIRIIDGNTVIDRDMNADELAIQKIIQDDLKAQAEAQAERAAARQAVLDKLGLTADEAAALLG